MLKITLAAARVNAGYTQKKAAELLGISNRTLWQWENGVSFPNQPEIEALCKLYNIHYDCINFVVR